MPGLEIAFQKQGEYGEVFRPENTVMYYWNDSKWREIIQLNLTKT